MRLLSLLSLMGLGGGILLLLAVLLMANSSAKLPQADKFGSHYIKVDHVYDGDTFYFRMPGSWPELSMVGVRVLGIDAPEKRGRCAAERQRANEAKLAAQTFLSRGPVELRNVRWDKYGGRIEADVLVDGQSLSSYMISQKLARPYHGEHRDKLEWCR